VVSIGRLRQILGRDRHLSDSDLILLREQLYALANVAIDALAGMSADGGSEGGGNAANAAMPESHDANWPGPPLDGPGGLPE